MGRGGSSVDVGPQGSGSQLPPLSTWRWSSITSHLHSNESHRDDLYPVDSLIHSSSSRHHLNTSSSSHQKVVVASRRPDENHRHANSSLGILNNNHHEITISPPTQKVMHRKDQPLTVTLPLSPVLPTTVKNTPAIIIIAPPLEASRGRFDGHGSGFFYVSFSSCSSSTTTTTKNNPALTPLSPVTRLALPAQSLQLVL